MSLKINFYCQDQFKGRVPEPIPASKNFPKWFSDLPFFGNDVRYTTKEDNIYEIIVKDELNLKRCSGITDFLNVGYQVLSWADFIFREQEDGRLYVNWMENYYTKTKYISHDESQYSTMTNKPIYGHFGKIESPWIVKTDPGVSCFITHPYWHRNKSFTTVTGICHTDIAPMIIPWFFEWNYKIESGMDVETMNQKKQIVVKGEPLFLIIPFYRKEIFSKINYISEKQYDNMVESQANLTRRNMGNYCPYKNFRKINKKMFW